METSSDIYHAQVKRDHQHHTERLAWLNEDHPTYACGTPVAAIDVINWKVQSEACLADSSNMTGYNTGPQENEERS